MMLSLRLIGAFLILFLAPNLKAETVSNIPAPREAVPALQNALDRYVARGANQIEKELNCVRERLRREELQSKADQDPKNDFTSKFTKDDKRWACQLKNLSPHMQRSFEKFKMFSNDIERALFLSHVMVESGALEYFSERKTFDTGKCLDDVPQEISAGNALITDIITTELQAEKFGPGGGAGSWSMGSDRGFGPIQITGCSNRLSVIHYLNQFYRNPNLTPSWRENWTYGAGGSKQIGMTCTDSQRTDFIRYHGMNTGHNADLYGAFNNSGNLATVGGTVTDPELNLAPTDIKVAQFPPMSSTEFMFDASLAYWKGRNQELIANLSTPADLYTSECKDYHYRGEDSWDELAVRCSTRRIRGLHPVNQKSLLDSSTKERLIYFRALQACML